MQEADCYAAAAAAASCCWWWRGQIPCSLFFVMCNGFFSCITCNAFLINKKILVKMNRMIWCINHCYFKLLVIRILILLFVLLSILSLIEKKFISSWSYSSLCICKERSRLISLKSWVSIKPTKDSEEKGGIYSSNGHTHLYYYKSRRNVAKYVTKIKSV